MSLQALNPKPQTFAIKPTSSAITKKLSLQLSNFL